MDTTKSEIPYVRVVFGISGLGDRSYNDVIYSGVWAAKLQHGENKVNIESFCPGNLDKAESVIKDWFENRVAQRELLILSAPAFAEMFDNHPEWKCPQNCDIFILDSKRFDMDLYTWFVSLYGVSHLAGQMIQLSGADSLAIVLANSASVNIAEACDGMSSGYKLSGGNFSDDDIYYLSNDVEGGYDTEDSLYRLCYTLDRVGYDFVAPIAGGSGQGVYRYTRMNNPINSKGMFSTCGYDIDQQTYSKKVAFSVIKRMDLVVSEFITNWINGTEQEKHRYLGLDTDFVSVTVSNEYETVFEGYNKQIDSLKQLSIAAEQEYRVAHE